MNRLGKKQTITNDSWLEAVAHIEEAVSESDLDKLAKKTVKEIRKQTAGKKAAYAWSAGKDSIVLGNLCREAGIIPCVLVRCDLEYPAFVEWIDHNSPEGLTTINTHQDLDWLKRHPEMLFPKDSKAAALWFHIVQHRGQAQYYKDNGLDMLLLGRRKADGNYVGRGSNTYTNSAGVTRYSPLSDWTHEDILAYIHYRSLNLPPIYGWKNGYLCGTHPWPARQWTGTTENGWAEVDGIDHSIVEAASAAGIDSETDYLTACRR